MFHALPASVDHVLETTDRSVLPTAERETACSNTNEGVSISLLVTTEGETW